MKTKRTLNKLTSLLLTLMIVVGLFAATPMTVLTADANALKTTIETYGGGGLNAAISGNIITVTGSKTNATTALSLILDGNVTVVWDAALSGSTTIYNALVNIAGGGFTVSENGKIIQTGAGDGIALGINTSLTVNGEVRATTGCAIVAENDNATITVDGGVVTNTGTFETIFVDSLNSTVIVCGTGEVSKTGAGGPVIYSNGSVNIAEDARVIASSSRAIQIDGRDAVLTVSGGDISSAAQYTIFMNTGSGLNVHVTGGTIINSYTSGYAIHSPGIVFVSGGIIAATGTYGIKYSFGSTGAAIEKTGDTGVYIAGTFTDLDVGPYNTTAVWSFEDGTSGIRYTRGTLNGFFAVPGVTVHDYRAVVTEPTCENEGYTTYTCLFCGDEYIDEESYVPALSHNWDSGTVTKEPTEYEDGVMTYTCLRCSETKTESIPVNGHIHNYTAASVVDPTCTEQGYTVYACSCGDGGYNNDFTGALGHDFSMLVDHKDATADEDGYDVFKCSRCDEIKTVVIPATGAKKLIVNGIELDYRVVSGAAIIEPTQAQMTQILNAAGNKIIVDMSDYDAVNFSAAAAWFKDVDKTITFITAKGSFDVKTKTLWNNSGKIRLVKISNDVSIGNK